MTDRVATSRLFETARRSCPSQIDDIWNGRELRGELRRNLDHISMNIIDSCYDRATFASLLKSEERCRNLVESLTQSTVLLGMNAEDNLSRMGKITLVAACLGCNTPADAGGCQHGHSFPLQRLGPGTVNDELHQATKLLVFISALLTMDLTMKASATDGEGDSEELDVDMLCLLLAPKFPPGVDPVEYATRLVLEQGLRKALPTGALVGVLDNCSAIYPKAAHSTVGVFSLVMARRPSAVLGSLDQQLFCKSMFGFLGDCVFRLVHNANCLVEEAIGLVALLNSLPTLYYMVNVKDAHRILVEGSHPATVTTLIVNLACAAIHEESDRPMNLEEFPELYSTRVVAPLFGLSDTANALFQERPMSFAIGCLIEILGRWQKCGIPVCNDLIPTRDSAPVKVSDALEEHRDILGKLAHRSPALTPILKIADAIIGGRMSHYPKNEIPCCAGL